MSDSTFPEIFSHLNSCLETISTIIIFKSVSYQRCQLPLLGKSETNTHKQFQLKFHKMNFVEDIRFYILRNCLPFKQSSWNRFHADHIQFNFSALPAPSLGEFWNYTGNQFQLNQRQFINKNNGYSNWLVDVQLDWKPGMFQSSRSSEDQSGGAWNGPRKVAIIDSNFVLLPFDPAVSPAVHTPAAPLTAESENAPFTKERRIQGK